MEEFLIFAPRAWQLKGQIFVAAEEQQGRLEFVERAQVADIFYWNEFLGRLPDYVLQTRSTSRRGLLRCSPDVGNAAL